MTLIVEAVICCTEPGCHNCVPVWMEANQVFMTANLSEDPEGWYLAGKKHICPNCYEGSYEQFEMLRSSHIDDKIKAHKGG